MIKNKKSTKTTHENIFKGKLRCFECGKTLSLSIRKDHGDYRSFACSTYRRYTSRCSSHYITYDYLKDYLTGKINNIMKLRKLGKSKFIKQISIRKSYNEKIKELEKNKTIDENRLVEIDSLVKKLFEKYINGKINEDTFYELDKSYVHEKIVLIKSVRDKESKVIDLKGELSDVNTFYESIHEYDIITELKREDILKFVDKVIIHEKKNKHNKRIVEVYFVLLGKM